MRAYSRDDEERIRTQTLVRDWAKAGFLDAAQGKALDGELRTDLRRTNLALRAVLALFTVILVQAMLGLVMVSISINDRMAVTTTVVIAAIVCAVASEWLVRNVRVYRYGVEEALAVSSVMFLSFAVMYAMVEVWHEPLSRAFRGGLIVGAAGGFVLFRRYGFLYAAIAGLVCVAALPFAFELAATTERIAAAAAMAAAFVIARDRGRRHAAGFQAHEYDVTAAAACVCAYLLLNLHLFDVGIRLGSTGADMAWFHRTTYVVIWLIPAGALVLAIYDRNRPLLAGAIVMALLTLATNKSYLGWPRYSWDPMLLGALLMGVAIGVRRWLAAGPGGERSGFTAQRLAEADREIIRTIANASVGFQSPASATPSTAEPSGFAGGRSGGGGATTGF